jgi:hypothetical protein
MKTIDTIPNSSSSRLEWLRLAADHIGDARAVGSRICRNVAKGVGRRGGGGMSGGHTVSAILTLTITTGSRRRANADTESFSTLTRLDHG